VKLDRGRIEGIDVDEAGLARCRQRGLPCRRFDLEREDFPAPGRKPHYGYWSKRMLKRGWIRHLSLFRWHLRLGMTQDGLLFVLEKPA
jgi:hypothetical protein